MNFSLDIENKTGSLGKIAKKKPRDYRVFYSVFPRPFKVFMFNFKSDTMYKKCIVSVLFLLFQAIDLLKKITFTSSKNF